MGGLAKGVVMFKVFSYKSCVAVSAVGLVTPLILMSIFVQTSCSGQELQHPRSSVQGEQLRSVKNSQGQFEKDSPKPDAIPKSTVKSLAPPLKLVKNAAPLVITDHKRSQYSDGIIKPVAGTQDSQAKQSRPKFKADSALDEEVALPAVKKSIAAPPKAKSVQPENIPVHVHEDDEVEYVEEDDFDDDYDLDSILPVADDHDEHDHDGHVHFRSAMFLGIGPGKSSSDDVARLIGAPKKVSRLGGKIAHLYAVDEVDHIEILFKNDIVDSIDIMFSEAYPVDQVREIFASELQKTRPVSFADENGDVIGLMFPEKGVTLVYTPSEEPGVPSAMVKKISIAPISAEPFVIRAKGYLEDSPADSMKDLKVAIALEPTTIESYWLLAQIEVINGDGAAAFEHVEKALAREQSLPQYHITLAKSLVLMNRLEEAKIYLEEMLPICERYLHQKAVALCLLGDIYRSGSVVDCEAAYSYHKEAIDIAVTLRNHANPTVRAIARDVLVNAQLGVVKDIAMGTWDNKWQAIDKWFASVKEVIKDPEVTSKKRLIREYLFRVAVCSLSAQAVVSDSTSIEPYVQDVLTATEELVNVTDDEIAKRKVQWEAGNVLFEAVQSYQRRKQYTSALKYGETTVDLMEQGIEGRTGEADYYLLSRLYFRLGAIHAIGMKNHRSAIVWFDRTMPIFDDILPGLTPEEVGRVGEMLVSMGVSYWEMDQKDEAVRLSELGLKKIRAAVDSGDLEQTSLLIPYSNLSTMWGKLDVPDKSERYHKLAVKIRESMANSTANR